MDKTDGIKNQSMMNFDKVKEAELRAHVIALKSAHKLGDFNAACIRACWENPELFRKAGYAVEQFGLTDDRAKFFYGVEKQMLDMRHKVDGIYDIALKLYTLVQFGKKLGLEKRSEQVLQASFCIQRQIDELSGLLGISNLSHVWESNKLETTAQKSEDILEFIIEAYEDTVNELRESELSRGHMRYTDPDRYMGRPESVHSKSGDRADRLTSTTISGSADDNNAINTSKHLDSSVTSTSGKQNQTEKDSNMVEVDLTGASEEIVDFGTGADLDLLASFVGA